MILKVSKCYGALVLVARTAVLTPLMVAGQQISGEPMVNDFFAT